MSIGIWQVILILLIVLIIFGAGKLPKVMGDVAKRMKSFKSGLKDDEEETRGRAATGRSYLHGAARRSGRYSTRSDRLANGGSHHHREEGRDGEDLIAVSAVQITGLENPGGIHRSPWMTYNV